MDVSSLRALGSMELLSVLTRAAVFGGEIWQSVDDQRTQLPIQEIKLEENSGQMIFKVKDAGVLDPKLPIFVHLAYRNLIFSLPPLDFILTADKILCHYPETGRALEERTTDRYLIPQSSQISLSLKKLETSVKEIILDLEVRIVDVSHSGFGLLISYANRDFLRRYDNLWIRAIDQRPLQTQILGTVCYVSPKKHYIQKGDVRVGISLGQAVTPEIFNHLIRRSSSILTA